jgi:DNA-binding Xre family transcriptional regulator
MIRIKDGVDVLGMLARCGFTSYEIRRQHLIGQSELQRIRQGGLPSWETLNFICETLCMQPGELIEYVDDR